MQDGKYIGFIDSDDYINDEYIEKLMDRALINNADIVKCGYYAENKYTNFKKQILYKDVSVTQGLKDEVLEIHHGFLWGGVIKNELFNNFRIPENSWYEDMIMNVIIYRKCQRFEYINEALYHYVQHDENISKKVEKGDNLKCLSQYFLAIKLYELSNQIGLENDDVLYRLLLRELGGMLWSRTRKLDKKIRKQVFLCASEFMNQFKINDLSKLKENEKNYKIAFEKQNYVLWKLTSQYARWS